jgi:hypothetical protein
LLVTLVVILFSNAIFADVLKEYPSKNSIRKLKTRVLSLEKQVRLLNGKINNVKFSGRHTSGDGLLTGMYGHGPVVVTSPVMGKRSYSYDASDLIVRLPSINEDLVLLSIRKKMDDYAKNRFMIPERPIVALSGAVEGRLNSVHHYNGMERSDINLSNAELDIVGEAGPWATTVMVISYDDSRLSSGSRVSNSKLGIDRGFITIGQLNKFPMYLTIGQINAPFGAYSSRMLTDTATKVLGKFKDRMVVVGFNLKGLSAQIFGFPGETKTNDHNVLRHAGFNLNFEHLMNKFKFTIGNSVIGNLAESNGMQKIFANSNFGNEVLQKDICGIDSRIKVSYDNKYSISAEYVGAAEEFGRSDLRFNTRGAKPQAFHTEAAVDFLIRDMPSMVAIGCGHTSEALALNVSKNYFFTSYNISLIKGTTLGFEYRHDVNYNWNDVARGPVKAIPVDGRHRNTITANLAVYF